jgi:hypothetical protein
MGQRWREFLTDANGFKLVTSTINLLILNKSQTKTAKHSRKISVLKAFIINQMTLLSYNSREARQEDASSFSCRTNAFITSDLEPRIQAATRSEESVNRIPPDSLSQAKAFCSCFVQR